MQLKVLEAEFPKINDIARSKLVNGKIALSEIPRIGMQIKKARATELNYNTGIEIQYKIKLS
jgi:hypothetical protein